MRIIAFLLLAICISYPAMANDENIGSERADVATGIFKKACFFNYGNKEKSETFLNSRFQKHDDDKKKLFLDFTKTDKGDVWIAVFPKGMFAIVLSDKGNCHVIAQKADRDKVHENMKSFADETMKNAQMSVNVHDKSMGSATISSGFDVLAPNGKPMMVVVASTPTEQAPNKPDAIITMAVEGY